MGKSIEEILRQMESERNQRINEEQSNLDQINHQRDLARKEWNKRMRMYENLSSNSSNSAGAGGGGGSTTTPSTPTILEYNTDLGSSFVWDGITFTLDTSLSNYSYTANITSIPDQTGHLPGYVTLIGVTIGNTVTSIGDQAFYFCANLASVIIGNSVLSIGVQAFADCTGLLSITIPDSVTSIGDQAFYFCANLASVIIGNSVLSIGADAFINCTSLTSITIPDSVTSIEYGTFQDCTNLTSIIIGNSVLSIGNYAFTNCTSLTSITIPDSVTSIGDIAFNNCTLLETITIPDSVLSIGVQAFADCTGLLSITIPDSVTSIGNFAFKNCSASTSLTFGNSVTSIGSFAFNDCVSLTTVSIPGTVGSISESAFANCTGLISVTILSGVTNIDTGAFSGCVNLTNVTIPATIVSIGANAFYNTNIISITIPDSVVSIGANAFLNSELTTVTIANGQLAGITSPDTGVDFFGATVTTVSPASVPTVTSDSYGSLSGSSATVTGTITSDGGSAILERGIVWSTSPNPTISNNKVVGTGTAVETFTQTYLIPNPYAYIYVRTYATNAYGTGYGTDLYFILPCFVKGTKITMFDRTKKNIEDISYEDNLLVWNFDDGQFDSAKPLWIMEMVKTPSVNILFSDGSKLGISGYLQHDGGHRIFNLDKGEFTYAIPNEHTPIGTRTFNDKGEIVTIVGKEQGEFAEIYNVVTNRHLNIFAEGALTSRRLNNIYPISDMRFIKEERTITPIEEFMGITEEYYNGLRLGEQPLVKVSEGFLTKSPGELAYTLPTIEELAEWTLGFILKKYEPVYEDTIS